MFKRGMSEEVDGSVVLRKGEVVYFQGCAELTVKENSVVVNGRRLGVDGKKYLLDAPIGSCAIRLSVEDSSLDEVTQRARKRRKKEVELEEDGAVVEFITVPRNELFTEDDKLSSSGYICVKEGKDEIPEWVKIPSPFCINTNSLGRDENTCVLVCGPRNSGKSSCCRQIINTFLNSHESVYYLETDLGQPELTPTGIVSLSLLTSPLLCVPHSVVDVKTWPSVAYFIGDNSPKRNPLGYIYYSGMLMRKLMESDGNGNIPVVVNTHGWMSGLGLELLMEIIQIVRPTDIVVLGDRHLDVDEHIFGYNLGVFSGLDVVFDRMEWNSGSLSVHHVSSCNIDTKFSPVASDIRALHLAVYFSRLRTSTLETSVVFSSFSEYITHCVPYRIRLSDIDVNIIGSDLNYSSGDQLRLLNTAIVGLCNVEGECIGIGIVRSVDNESQTVYILTPLHLMTLRSEVRCISCGALYIPLLFVERTDLGDTPYFVADSLKLQDSGARPLRARSDFRR